DCVDDAKNHYVDDTIKNSSLYPAAQVTGLFGTLALLGGAIYTLVWGMRTGLLSRFTATVGMLFIASLVLVPPLGPIGIVLWFAIVGLMLSGLWPRPLPRAWAAAEAIPWPRGGEDSGEPGRDRRGAPLEGSGREVSERPLPEDGTPEGPVGAPPHEDQP